MSRTTPCESAAYASRRPSGDSATDGPRPSASVDAGGTGTVTRRGSALARNDCVVLIRHTATAPASASTASVARRSRSRNLGILDRPCKPLIDEMFQALAHSAAVRGLYGHEASSPAPRHSAFCPRHDRRVPLSGPRDPPDT